MRSLLLTVSPMPFLSPILLVSHSFLPFSSSHLSSCSFPSRNAPEGQNHPGPECLQDIWSFLETSLVVTTGGGGVPLAFGGQRPVTQLSIVQCRIAPNKECSSPKCQYCRSSDSLV